MPRSRQEFDSPSPHHFAAVRRLVRRTALSLLVPRIGASGHELDVRGSTPRREAFGGEPDLVGYQIRTLPHGNPLVHRSIRAGSLARNVVCKTAVPGPIPGRLSTLEALHGRLPARGASSLGEHRSDMPVQASSILAPRTTSTWRNRQTRLAQTRASGSVLGRFAPCARSAAALRASPFATNLLVDTAPGRRTGRGPGLS